LEDRIANDRRTRLERTEGYSDNLNALRREFGIDPEQVGSQSIGVDRARTQRGYSQQESQWREEQDPFAGLIDPALAGTCVDPRLEDDEAGFEDEEENELTTSNI
jgi:hypothetical protein